MAAVSVTPMMLERAVVVPRQAIWVAGSLFTMYSPIAPTLPSIIPRFMACLPGSSRGSDFSTPTTNHTGLSTYEKVAYDRCRTNNIYSFFLTIKSCVTHIVILTIAWTFSSSCEPATWCMLPYFLSWTKCHLQTSNSSCIFTWHRCTLQVKWVNFFLKAFTPFVKWLHIV